MGNATDELDGLRDEIDRIDDRIVELIAERVHTAERVAAVKSVEGKDIVDTDREADVVARYEERFRREDLGGANGRDLAESLIEISIERERAVEGDTG